MAKDMFTNHFGMVSRRAFMKGAGAIGLSTVFGVPAFAAGEKLRWGSSSLGSSGYVILEAMAKVVNNHTDMKNSVQATAGTTENFALIGSNTLDIIHTTSIDWVSAARGDKPFREKIHPNQLLTYTKWLMPPLVFAKSDIKSIADLKGRSYSPSKPGSGTASLARILFKHAGLIKELKWRYGGWKEVYNNFQIGQIDCVNGVFPNSKPFGLIMQVETAVKLRALEFPEEVLKAAAVDNPGILIDTLTPNDWPVLTKPIRCPAFSGILGASTKVSAEAGYNITKSVLDNIPEIRKFGKYLNGIDLENAVNGLLPAFPVNAGAAQYYKEKGVWRKDLKIAS